MTYQQYQQYLERELASLNWMIDERIARGLSYRKEARRHKELIQQARKMRRRPIFSRFASFASML